MLSKEQILSFKPKMESLIIPEWDNGEVFIRVMSGDCRDKFETALVGLKDDESVLVGIRAKLAVWTLCDETGKPIFDESDLEAVGALSCAALDRIFEVAKRINHLTGEDVDELEKKLEAGQS